jgi:lipopolysaccharide exporter
MATRSLAARVGAGVSWTTASAVIGHVLTLARTIVLARLLEKEDFGLFGMAVTILGALTALTNMGLDGSMIVNKFSSDEERDRQLNTIWTIELGRRLLLSLLLLLAAQPTANFYGSPSLLPILYVLSVVPLLEGLGSIGLVLLRRQVNFARITAFDLSCNLAYTVVPILTALWRRDVWALVWGQVIVAAGCSLGSYLVHPYRPRLAFDPESFGRAFRFGKYMFVIGVMVYITTTADNILIGKLLGAEILGAYLVAYSLAALVPKLFGHVCGSVLFPAYAELGRDRGDRLERAVVRVFVLATAALVLLVAPAALLAQELVLLLYGEKWAAAGPLLQILMLMGFGRGLLQLVGPLLMGLNRPDLEARSKVLEGVFFLCVLFPLTLSFGPQGAAWAGVLVALLSCLVRFSYARSLVPKAFAQVPAIVLSSVLTGLGGALAGAGAISGTDSILARCALGGVVSLCATALLLWLFKPALRAEARQAWKKLRR